MSYIRVQQRFTAWGHVRAVIPRAEGTHRLKVKILLNSQMSYITCFWLSLNGNVFALKMTMIC